MNVKKRDLRLEKLDIDKIHRVLEFACLGHKNVSISQIELKAHIQFFDGMTTDEINSLLIKSASGLISAETLEYTYVAATLINYGLRKSIYDIDDPANIPTLHSIYTRVRDLGFYDTRLGQVYSEEEFEYFNGKLKHDLDYDFDYAAMMQWNTRYLVRNRVTDTLYETPQIAYMLIAMTGFMNYPKDRRTKMVVRAYSAFSSGSVSIPTPVLAGCRTQQFQYSSCTLIDTLDSLDSMNAASNSIVKYAANKAGIGLNLGRIRALKSPIRNGDAFHTGIIPFIQYFQASLKSCSQGGVRGSAGTFAYPIWHYEFPELIVLKNNKGTEETRARKVDYSVQLNELFYRRMLTGGNITLFSPHDVPDLLSAFYSKDIENFTRLYEKYEADSTIRKRVFSASEIFTMLMTERVETGRIYIQNMDNTNSHTPFNTDLTPLTMSNLCQEITLPTVPMEYPGDPNGEIALCILGAINWGKVATHSQMEENCDILVRFLDSLIDIQSYPVEAAKTSTMKFRSLGIGVTNLAYALAKQNVKYGSPESLKYCYEMMEAQQYFCTKTSVELAKEFGAPVGSSMTSRGNGVMPAFTQKKEAYDMMKESGYEAHPNMDWDSLSEMILQYGIRNATLTAIMPVESSSVIIGATNGVEPPRSLVATKMNKELVVKQPVPGLRSVGKGYELLWDVDALEYLKVMATLQLWNDQSISTNTSYVPSNYDGDEIPFQVLMKHLILWWKWGGKTLYYHNTKDDSGEVESGDECVGCKL